MAQQSRRQFLQRAVVVGAGSAVFPAALTGASAKAASGGTALTDPGFVTGRVAAVSGSSIAVIDGSGVQQRLRLGSQSQVWKNGAFNQSPLAVGDRVDARGGPDGNAVLAVDRLWANIENVRGVVTRAGSNALSLARERGKGQIAVSIDPTAVVHTSSGSIAQGTAQGLSVGDDLIAIGYSDPSSGALTLTLIFASQASPAPFSTEPPTVQNVGPNFTIRHRGVTSFFDCPPSACGTCSSGNLQCAWPKLTTGCGPFNGNCSLDPSFERHSCGVHIPVMNACTGASITVTIADCGPTIRCVPPVACNGYTKVFLDLTRAAFSAIGNLNAGLLDVYTGDAF